MPRLVDPAIPAGRMRAMTQPSLEVDHGVTMRPWTTSDAPAVMEAFSDPAIRYWHMRSIESVEEASDWIDAWRERWQAESNASWALVGDDGRVRGQIALRGVNLGMGASEVSYWVVPVARGRGIASAALTRLATWSFDELGLRRLWLMHAVDNAPSCKVAVRAAFEPEGTLREALRHTDGWHDMHVHGRLASDG